MTYFGRLARAFAFVMFVGSSAVQAQEFFKGKSINIYSDYAAGAANDTVMRLVAHHIRNFIPGSPNFIPRNMPGAAGVLLGNFLYGSAPQDGLSVACPGARAFCCQPPWVMQAQDTT